MARVTPLTRTRDHYRESLAEVERIRDEKETAARRTTIYDREQLRKVRSSARSAGRRAREDYERELDQRVGHLGWRIRAPERLERRAERIGGGYRSRQAGSYDWFYSLDPKEQARVRRNWMSSSSSAPSPDEIEKELPIEAWLDLTRAVDMSKAVASGRHVNRRLYGGRTPESLIAGEPYDLRELHHQDDERAARHVRRSRVEGRIGKGHAPKNPHNVRRGIAYKADGSLDVQFFTDEEGRVHPIRASYETMSAEERRRARMGEDELERRRRTGKVRYFNRATGTVEEYDYQEPDDVAF